MWLEFVAPAIVKSSIESQQLENGESGGEGIARDDSKEKEEVDIEIDQMSPGEKEEEEELSSATMKLSIGTTWDYVGGDTEKDPRSIGGDTKIT